MASAAAAVADVHNFIGLVRAALAPPSSQGCIRWPPAVPMSSEAGCAVTLMAAARKRVKVDDGRVKIQGNPEIR
jgi:hypothetical protein